MTINYPPPETTRESIAQAIRAGAATTEQVAAACGVPHDDRLLWEIAGMAADGWFAQVPAGPGTWRYILAPGR